MESTLQKKILLLIGGLANVRLFRNNTGQAWQGEGKRTGNAILLRNPRPLVAGLCKGSSDLIGWTTIEITKDMVGQKVAVFTALEIKDGIKSKATKEQTNFILQVQKGGGYAGIAYDEKTAQDILNGKPF